LGIRKSKSRGLIFVISAPSGCGKTSLMKALLKEDKILAHPASFTTRPKRTGERDGVDYHFISEDKFKLRLKEKDFLEWSRPFGWCYATSKSAILNNIKKSKDAILNLDFKGANFVKKNFKNSTLIYILPPSMGALRQRLIGRMTDHSAEIKKRLRCARKDIRNLGGYDYVVVNDSFREAVKKLKSIIVAERLRVR
jgi:guanylate kinase